MTKPVGKPREFEKNLQEPEYFENNNIDLSISVNDTVEYQKVHQNDNVIHYLSLYNILYRVLLNQQYQLFHQTAIKILLRKLNHHLLISLNNINKEQRKYWA